MNLVLPCKSADKHELESILDDHLWTIIVISQLILNFGISHTLCMNNAHMRSYYLHVHGNWIKILVTTLAPVATAFAPVMIKFFIWKKKWLNKKSYGSSLKNLVDQTIYYNCPQFIDDAPQSTG